MSEESFKTIHHWTPDS